MPEQALYRLLRLFSEVRARSRRCSSFPQKVTLGSPTQLQAPSRRFAVATNFLRVQIHHPKMGRHLFYYLLTCRSKVRFAPAYFYACGKKMSSIRSLAPPLRIETKRSGFDSVFAACRRFLPELAATFLLKLPARSFL